MIKKFLKIIIAIILIFTISQGQNNGKSIGNCDEIVKDNFGNIYTLNISAGIIKKYSSNYELLYQFNSNTGNQSIFVSPKNINIVEPDIVYLLDDQTSKILEFDEYLNFIQSIDLPEEFTFPSRFIVLSNRDWLIYDEFQKQIFRVKPGENISQSWGDKQVKHFLNEKVQLNYLKGFIYMFVKKRNRLLIINNTGMVKLDCKMPDEYSLSNLLSADLENIVFTDGKEIFNWHLRGNNIDTLFNYSNIIYLSKKNENFMISNKGEIIHYLPYNKKFK